MKYIFISDFFENEVNGGAELYDANLRKLLNSEYETKKCIQVNFPFLEKNKQNRFIISNFINLQPEAKKYLIDNCNYIIIEHDHKYLKTRDPSIFKDYVAPKDYIINYDFYAAAKSVVCQTELHATVVRKNLGLSNIVNFGGSIWSYDELDFLELQLENGHQLIESYAYQLSTMPNKGSESTRIWCEQNKLSQKGHIIPTNPIQPCEWKEFIKQLNKSTIFVFFPTVLETCSRVSVEARMLGLKVIGNNNISALKEDWFKKYKGKELIDYFRNKNKSIPEFINLCFSFKKEAINIDGDITVILNLYKRPQNLQKQVDAFRNQTIKPKEIWVWQNYADNVDFIGEHDYELGIDKWLRSNHNWGIFGRFTMAQMVKTKFVCINDDDTIPGPQWLETCLESFRTNPGLQGGIGVRLHDNDYVNHSRIGWAEPRPTTEEVDLVGHSWFFPKEYLKYMWMEEPFTWNMEDAHFSYCLQKYANIKTFVPPQIERDRSSSILGYELGIDENAMSHPKNHEKFYLERTSAIRHYLNNGWKKVLK